MNEIDVMNNFMKNLQTSHEEIKIITENKNQGGQIKKKNVN